MDASSRHHLADPEFDPLPVPMVRLRDFDPSRHQRLVVNPLLAVLGLILLGRLTVQVFRSTWLPPICVLIVLPILGLPMLIQYHCLDCGRTGAYLRRDRHACPSVFARWKGPDRSRGWCPSARTQLVIWGWLLGSIAILVAVLGS